MNEIESILCKIFHCDRISLYLEPRRHPLDSRRSHRLETILKKRLEGAPLQYLLGETEFMGLRLRLKPGVLIPRPETEVLAEAALEAVRRDNKDSCRILDIGTGCGNIAVALAAARTGTQVSVVAVDTSPACLELARANARRHHVLNKITFLESDLFSHLDARRGRFDLIVSNPPYVSAQDYVRLPDDVRREPVKALLAEDDGFYFYGRIAREAGAYLRPEGQLFLEIGYGQAKGIKEIFKDTSVWEEVQFIKDHNDIERVAVVKRVSHG